MELEGIDGSSVFVRGSDIFLCAGGTAELPSPIVEAVPGLRLTDGSSVASVPTTQKIPALILSVRGVGQTVGVKDTEGNREQIKKAMAA